MLMTPSFFLFWASVLLSILFMSTFSSFFLMWVALEINTMAFVPLLLSGEKSSGEGALKYFLSQTFGSILFLFPLLVSSAINQELLGVFMVSSMLLKLGAAPFHAWFPSVSEKLSWDIFFTLLTLQKLNPLMALSLAPFSSSLYLGASLSLLVGASQGLLQTQLRKILVYSSINQLGWLLLALSSGMSLVLSYLLFYTVLLSPVVALSKVFNLNSLSQIASNQFQMVQIPFYLTLLSMGGLPPFLGFLPKWLVLNYMISESLLFMALIMVVCSLLTLFFYLRLAFNSFLFSSNQWNFSTPSVSTGLVCGVALSLLTLPLGFMV